MNIDDVVKEVMIATKDYTLPNLMTAVLADVYIHATNGYAAINNTEQTDIFYQHDKEEFGRRAVQRTIQALGYEKLDDNHQH